MGRVDRVVGSAWAVCGASVLGAGHARRSVENQDAFRCITRPDAPVAVVADGHGAAPHLRSAVGARLAVDLLAEELAALDAPDDVASLKRDLHQATGRFIDQWQQAVLTSVAHTPFTDAEHATMTADTATQYAPDELALRAYGTTVLAVQVAAEWICAVAIGDGDLGCVDVDGGHRTLCPLPSAIGVQIDSLASADPRAAVRTDVCPAADIVAAWACTDGFSTAQTDPEWRALVGRQLRDLLATRTPDQIGEQLDGWLEPAAAVGDDTTMVLVLRDGASPANGRPSKRRPGFWRRL
jgi:hypothetical protein